MKLNKFMAVALAALAIVGCKPNDPNDPTDPKEETLVLDQAQIQLEVGATANLVANVAAEFTAQKEGIVTLTPANDGKTVVILGVAEGSVVITANTKGGQKKTCVVKVENKKGEEAKGVKGSQVWPIVLDGDAYAASESKIVASFQPNDVDQFLYVWDGTYEGGDGEGMNSLGNSGFTALKVTTLGWAGMGYCLTASGNGWEAAEALRAAIVANPDQYALHLAIKSTDNYSHCFYFMGLESTKFVLGPNAVYDGPVKADFKRDGAWHEFDIEMADYAAALAAGTCAAGVNVFVALTEGTQGAQLNLDAVYFYKK